MFIQPPSQKERVVAPAGLHTGVLYQIIDLGTHYNERFDNTHRKIRLSWELSEELMEDGRPLSVSREYTASLSEKSGLFQLIKSWLGEDVSASGFDVNVSNEVSDKGNTYAKVVGVTPLKKSEVPPKPANPLVLFSMFDGAVDTAVFNALPEFLKERIMASPEYQAAVARANGLGPQNKREQALVDDEIPF